MPELEILKTIIDKVDKFKKGIMGELEVEGKSILYIWEEMNDIESYKGDSKSYTLIQIKYYSSKKKKIQLSKSTNIIDLVKLLAIQDENIEDMSESTALEIKNFLEQTYNTSVTYYKSEYSVGASFSFVNEIDHYGSYEFMFTDDTKNLIVEDVK
eukprot:TRINITY_DN3766_c0_g1_i1.p1 TRINITY_DN3766_c0_g1~~TRINITY_DN3766_c0_g1_i1.p1  ORF type:complete len:155 (-),score=27.10 TRINITY_DN3766_c0_g1_i1:122-586(-)